MTPDLSHLQLEYLNISCYVEENQYQQNLLYDLPAPFPTMWQK